jgi:O-antigen biosynthesis protein
MTRVAVFTALFGSYDRLLEQAPADDVDFICFTDDASLTSRTWDVRVVDVGERGIRAARRVKTGPHRMLPDHEWTIWVDARLSIRSHELVPTLLRHAAPSGMAAMVHRQRHCAYDEAMEVYRKGFDQSPQLVEQIRRYRRAGFPAGRGLVSTMVVARRNDEQVRQVNERWWSEIERGSIRDQVSLPFVLWELGFEPGLVDLDPYENELYVLHHHLVARRYPRAWRQRLNAAWFAARTAFPAGRTREPVG